MTVSKDVLLYVVEPVLKYLHPEIPISPAAMALLMGTAAVESNMGQWIDQTTPGPGPAYGPWQMELATWRTNQVRLRRKPALQGKVGGLFIRSVIEPDQDAAVEMRGNWYYACAMARVHYYYSSFTFPADMTVTKLAAIWKAHYNTFAGKGTINGFINLWHSHGLATLFPEVPNG